MPKYVLSRRATGAVAAGALALAAVAVTAPPASAAPWAGQYGKGTFYSYSGAGCSASSPGTALAMVAMPANTPVSLDVADSATGTGPVAGDTGTMSASVAGTAQIAEGAGGVTALDVSVDLTANAARALGGGSACSASSQSAAVVTGTFTTSAAGLLDLHISNLGTGFGQHQITLIRTTPGPLSGSQTISVGETGRTHRVVSVQPGDYQVQVQLVAAATSSNAAGQPGPATNLKVRLHGDFKPFGVADGAQSGTGSKYVKLADGVTCASHSVTADFTKKAGKKAKKGQKPVISKATFYVNGAKVKTTKKPNKKTLVTLSGIPDDLVRSPRSSS